MNDQIQPGLVAPRQADVCNYIQFFGIQLKRVLPQWNQENAGYAPPHEAGGPIQVPTNVGPDQTQVVGLLVTESLRRLAGAYVNNPESLVKAVRLEPGASERFQVVITVEISDTL